MNRSGARLGAASALCISAGLVLSGCSTDTSRFDFPVLGVQQDPAPNQTTGTLPRERQRYDAPPPVDNEQIETAPNMRIGVRTQEPQEATPMSRTPSEVRVSNLPSVPAERQPVPPARLTMPQQSHDRKEALVQPTQSTLPAPVHQVHSREPLHVPPGGKIVEVGQGDTLYKLSRQHHVAISSIMTANHMQSPVIRQGQKLVIPPPESRARIPARPEQLASRTQPQSPVPAQSPQHTTVPPTQSAPKPTQQQQTAPRPAPTITGDTYTVQAGESFYAIARRMGVRSDDLAKYNGITDLSKLRQGQVLKIPPAEVRTNAPPRLAVQSPTPRNLPPAVQRTVPPAVQQQPTETEEKPPQVKKVASLNNPQTKTEAISSTGFRWPVKGKIVGKFGPRTDGSHNDGIDIAVPLGTEVAAAEDGVIAYAGNELKGYGNLILIRHDDNWVSAYAHNEQMLVKRGDKVKRGQVIAKAGKSGNIEQPIVHFELRQGSKPVDPTKHLAAN